MLVKSTSPSTGVSDALAVSLSPERLETYTSAAGGDQERALRLYVWNMAVSAEFYGPLQTLEVVLRNALHARLTQVYGKAWYDNPKCGLDVGALERIAAAKRDLTKRRYAVDPPHVVAALSFGFWVSLLGKGGRAPAPDTSKRNYDMTLWRKALYQAFPYGPGGRADTHKPLDYLRTFRNRIAHHEPIFARCLASDYVSILNVTCWISPETAAWIDQHSRVTEVLARIPEDCDLRL